MHGPTLCFALFIIAASLVTTNESHRPLPKAFHGNKQASQRPHFSPYTFQFSLFFPIFAKIMRAYV